MSSVVSEEKSRNNLVVSYLTIGGIVILAMMVFGVLMLLAQGGVLEFTPAAFYQFLTIHGTGMVGAAAFAAAGVMWYFLSKYVELSKKIMKINLVLFLVALVMVIIGVFSFEYASAWTFLYPLPAISANAWGVTGALLYLFGMLILGVGFLLLHLDMGRAIIKKYGSLAKGLGWDVISGKKAEKDAPSSTVVASTMVTIVNVTAITAGAIVLIMNIINVINPSFTFDPLLAKNLTFAFGHIFANSIIYMAVIAVYEILSKYTNRPWKANKPFLIAWTMSTAFTLVIYTHHMLMDPVMPKWMLIMGQILSYANGLPVLVITAYGALMIVYKSGIKWDMGSGLIYLSMFGWVVGVVPAIVDATIVVNHVMHNTKWVPGHFHMYMALGACAMIFGFMYYLAKQDSSIKTNKIDKLAFIGYTIGILGISGSFLVSGALSTPRRWATHFPEWMAPANVGAVAGVLAVLSLLVFVIHFVRYLNKRNKVDYKQDDKKLA
ncbi:cytochrome C oxidase subunit I [Virgibacillus profundi]|uniref:Cytochrome C oxidase subunit I n=1 Tax=Virgibacillus profundi TaxID=2024555 RepID=A0A2A2IIE7_9BACI|nr:cbb3-type cytochrome c oxidase subunit I [Virgibacillus profundi]PAV31034.1 cytochrome C oxidase subunit I [Virgibacillus profundi]PXY55220.1 cytochrome C oxidase subunit I [Virgibacillus profundi]